MRTRNFLRSISYLTRSSSTKLFNSHLSLTHLTSHPVKKYELGKGLISSFAVSPETKSKMLQIGYKEEQLIKKDTVDFFLKHGLTEAEENKLAELGYTLEQINHMNVRMLTYCDFNSTDDGFGMRPMTRHELMELLLRDRPSPDKEIIIEEKGNHSSFKPGK